MFMYIYIIYIYVHVYIKKQDIYLYISVHKLATANPKSDSGCCRWHYLAELPLRT